MGGLGGPQEIPIVEPKIFKLYQSYPNSTTKATVIKFQIPVKTAVSLKVYDVSGRVVRTLTRAQNLKPKIYTVEWNERNNKGMKLPAGVYFYRLETKEYKSTKKLVWVR